MKDLKIFKNEEFGEVRVIEVDGEPWFVGKDVAKSLGYGEGKSLNNAVARHVDDDDKGVTEIVTPGGKQNIIIINESGLYSLILSSKLPNAKKFKRWITSEVLPSKPVNPPALATGSVNRMEENLMSDLKVFKNEEFGEIRTIVKDGDPWFVGKDIAGILGYSDTNKAISMHVDEDDKLNDKTALSLGQRGGWIINESGLYSLILSSKLPNAKKFKRWVTNEVLPSVRKHGVYMTSQIMEEVLLNPDTIIKIATSLKEEREQRIRLQNKIEENKPKVLFADSVASSKTTILIGDLAKLLKQNGINVGQNRLFEWLRNNGYLIKRQGTDYNSPTQMAMEKELFQVKETTVYGFDGTVKILRTTKVTGKGQLYFIDLFLSKKAVI